jgi:hypothetical protein
MRLAAVAAAAFLLAVPAAASAEEQTLDATATLGKRSVVLDIAGRYFDPSGARPRDPKTMTLRFPRGARWNGAGFPACAYSRLPYCPRRTLVATGTALADARPMIPDPFTANVSVYNAKTKRGKPSLVFLGRSDAGPEARFEMTFSFPRRGAFGTVLTFPVMKQFGPTPLFTIAEFKIRTLDKSFRRKPLIQATSCPGSFRFEFENRLPSGERFLARDTLPCPTVG